ncbi:MAG: filamentous hemagglutinin N-terminal domain-containing protein, partial [Novosphingobium sp.]|nr:filamentous hemagglutinin N-terminal domain-containing protein [Novosphingobium sp.]
MTVASQNRRLRLQLGTALVGTLGMLPCSTLAQTLPQTPSVAVGTAAVTSNGTTMQVDIRNTNPVINWDSFNIGSGKTVNFVSTDGGAPPTADLATPYAVLNRVDHLTGINHSYTAATIDGTLSGQSNIAVWLVDPAGITFGSTGTFSGGSLVLSTLEVSNAEFTAGGSQSFLVALETDPHVTLNGGSSVITLTGGSGALTSAGSILILGEKVSIGKSVSATGPIGIVAADAVTFPSSAASPLSYNITAGTSLAGGGVHILGTGTLSGQSVTLAAVSVGTAIGSILQVDSGATLTATQDGGAIVLATKTDGGNTILLPNGDGIVVNGALATTGANGSVRAISAGGATVAGNVTTTGTGTYQVTGTSVTIGGAGTVTQTGASGITLTSTSGDVTGNTGATLTSGAGGTIAVTSAAAATIRSNVNAGNQFTVTGTSVIVGGTSQTATNLLKLNATGGSATTEAGLTLTSSTNNVQIDATAGLALNANSSAAGQYLPTASGGDVAIGGSSTQAGATGATITASTGNITAATGSAVNSSTGTVAFSAANGTAQVLSNVSAGNQYTVTAKSLEAGGTTQTAANLVWLKATAGSATTDAGLTLGSTTNNVQIDATTGLTLNGTITANQAFTATTAAGNITGNASITSDIAILGTNPIILDAPLGTINMGLTSSLNAGTSVVGLRYAAGSNVSLGNVSAGNIADYTPGAPPTFNSAPFGTNITDFTAGTVNVINALNIQVLGNIRMTAANSSSSTVGLRGLDITGTSGGSGTRSDTGFGRVAVSAAGGVSIAATGLAQGATVSTTSGNVVISGGNNLPPSNGSVDLSSVSAPLGAVTISAYSTSTTNPYDGDIIVGGIVAGSTVSVFNNAGTSGDITLSGTNSTTAANFTVNAIKQASVSGPVTINTTGSYSVTGSSVVLGNGTAMTQTAPNNITITANSGDLTLQNGLTLNATGVASSALTLASTTGAVLAGAGSVLKTTSGDVTINAANSATIASAVDSGGQYLITAGTGFEVGDTGGATVIQKAAGQIKLTTSAGTGKADAGLTLNSTGSDVILAAPGGLTLNANVTAASLYQATAPAGSITVGGNSTQSGNAGVTIVATGGNLTAGFGSTLTSSGGAVNLGATGGTATIDSAVSAGSDFLVRAGTINLATLATGPVTQTAVATVDIKSAIGAINGGTNLRLVSGTGGSVGFPTSTFLDSATLVNLALGSSVDATNSAFFITVPANQAVSLGDVHALFIATVDAAHTTTPLTLTGIGDFTAGTITASRLQLSSSGSIRLRALNTFASGFSANVQLVGVNVTGLPGASIGTSDTGVGRFDVSTANNLIVSANGLIQGGTLGAATMTLTGGNVSGSLANGSIDVGTITATTGLTATAYSTSAVDARTDGDIRIGRATVSAGSASLSNIAGGGTPVGDVVIADKLTASGNIGIDSANDVITAAYDAVADTGYVKSTGGT